MNSLSRKPVLLLVDDDVMLRDAMVDFLNCDFDIIQAGSVEEASQRIRSADEIDLLITDLELKCGAGEDGVSVAIRLREKFPTTPILLISGSAPMNPRIEHLLRMGRSDFLPKPFDATSIETKVEGLLMLVGQ